MNCIFCKIINGEIPSSKVYEDEYVYAFRDINPQAPTHVLVVPKAHVANVAEAAQQLNADACVFALFFLVHFSPGFGIVVEGVRITKP